MNRKETIFELLDLLIVVEAARDSLEKKKDPNLSGLSSTLFHLKKLKELLKEELK